MKKQQYLWGNGIGIEPELWFNKPQKFHFKRTNGNFGGFVEDYVPIWDKKSNFYDGGYNISRKGIQLECGESITCLSKNYDDVVKFTKLCKKMLKYNDYWQSNFFRTLKKNIKK
mgnify:CR=1 FL=1